jgi:quercetin dioxygenase-like cupin family protein
MKTALLFLALAGAAAPSVFQAVLQDAPKPAAPTTPKEIVVVKAASVKWVDHPAVQGAKMCALSADPSKGPSVVLVKFPKGTAIPPHWHTSDEIVTVVSGSGLFGTGETADPAKATELTSGSYITIPGKSAHWANAKDELIISITTDKPNDFHLCSEKK